jgi:hypothetical protein
MNLKYFDLEIRLFVDESVSVVVSSAAKGVRAGRAEVPGP